MFPFILLATSSHTVLFVHTGGSTQGMGTLLNSKALREVKAPS
jgi:hypothetical protein